MKSYRKRLNGASITVHEFDDGLNQFLSGLYVTPYFRDDGRATALMNQVIKDADKDNVRLGLIVRAYGKPPGMNNQQLIDFYKKFGFVEIPRRDPAKKHEVLMKRFEKGYNPSDGGDS